jgi:CDP-diacylglycerol--serine O-phosphatidyltransferase
MTKPLREPRVFARRRRVRVRPIGALSINRMIPNMLTLAALCTGMTAIRFAMHAKWETAVIAIVIAAVLDALDGRVARLLKSSSTFGAQLDSLSDFVCFGVAPAFILYLWTMIGAHSIGWIVALLFTACCALRLARFNTQLGVTDSPVYAAHFFTGVPAPAGAGLALLPLVAWLEFGADFLQSPWLCAATTTLIGGMMVSRVPTYSFKKLRIPHEYVAPLLVLIVLLLAMLTTEPWLTMLLLGLAYVATFGFSIRAYQRFKRAADTLRAQHRAEVARPDLPLLRAVESGTPPPPAAQ